MVPRSSATVVPAVLAAGAGAAAEAGAALGPGGGGAGLEGAAAAPLVLGGAAGPFLKASMSEAVMRPAGPLPAAWAGRRTSVAFITATSGMLGGAAGPVLEAPMLHDVMRPAAAGGRAHECTGGRRERLLKWSAGASHAGAHQCSADDNRDRRRPVTWHQHDSTLLPQKQPCGPVAGWVQAA